MPRFLKLIRNERGTTAIEYGLIAALVAVSAIASLFTSGNELNDTFSGVDSSMTSANS